MKKIQQFLSSVKRDAHKRKTVPFFCLTVHIAATDSNNNNNNNSMSYCYFALSLLVEL